MQLSNADFLLEPKARAEGANRQSATAPSVRQPEQHHRFSSVFAQQQQHSVAPAPAERTGRDHGRQDPPAAQQRAAAARNDQPGRSTAEPAPARGSGQKAAADRQQGAGTAGQKSDTKVQEQKIDADGEMPEQPAAGWVQIDPLLLQVMQANQGDAGLNPELADQIDGFLIDGMDALPQEVFANILAGQAAAAQSDGKLAGEAVRSSGQLQQLATQQLAAEGEVEGESELTAEIAEAEPEPEPELELELETGPAVRTLSAQLAQQAQQAGDSSERAAIRQAGEVKTTAEPLVRSDGIQRTESLQQAGALRQLPGQPLNMQQPGWSKELTDKVMWMSAQNLKSAEIKMNPAELGRLEIRIQVGSEQTQVSFVSANASVRDSLDSQMHRLREMLAQQGMQDVDVNVSDQSADEHDQRQLRELAGAAAGAGQQAEDEVIEAVTELPQQNTGTDGRLSYYV